MRCLVTGASGHIGSHLARLLAERGHEVTAMVRTGGVSWRLGDVLDRIELVSARLDDPESLSKVVRSSKPQVVFHLAWAGVAGPSRNLPANVIASVEGSLRLFGLAQNAGCECWVGLGSQAEYGSRNEILREYLAPLPDTLYGSAKLNLSALTGALCRDTGIRFAWLQLAAAYGPMDDPKRMIPSLIETLLAGERPKLTAGTQEWDYLYVDDAVEAIYRAGTMSRVQGTFLLGSGVSHSVRLIAEKLRDIVNPAAQLGFGEIPAAPGGDHSLRVDPARFRDAAEWTPLVDLDEGLQRTVAWHTTGIAKPQGYRAD